MGLFDMWGYTNFHELNLAWILKKVKDLESKIEHFIQINAIKYADPIAWDIRKQYEANTVVIDEITGIAYLSTDSVPSGVSITNTDYWTPIFDLGALVTMINNNLTSHIEDMGVTNATFESVKGDWILWNGLLYIVIVDSITVGTQYVADVNIRRTTIEEQSEIIYYPADKKLSLHGKIASDAPIIASGDYHVYNPQRQAIEIIREG